MKLYFYGPGINPGRRAGFIPDIPASEKFIRKIISKETIQKLLFKNPFPILCPRSLKHEPNPSQTPSELAPRQRLSVSIGAIFRSPGRKPVHPAAGPVTLLWPETPDRGICRKL